MQVTTGTAVKEQIVVEGVSLTEGVVVAVVTHGADESFSLTETQENELLAAIFVSNITIFQSIWDPIVHWR